MIEGPRPGPGPRCQLRAQGPMGPKGPKIRIKRARHRHNQLLDKVTTALDKVTTVQDKVAIVLDKVTTVLDKVTTVLAKTTTVLDKVATGLDMVLIISCPRFRVRKEVPQ